MLSQKFIIHNKDAENCKIENSALNSLQMPKSYIGREARGRKSQAIENQRIIFHKKTKIGF